METGQEQAGQFAWCILCHRTCRIGDWAEGAACPRRGARSFARYRWEYLRRVRGWLPEVPDPAATYDLT